MPVIGFLGATSPDAANADYLRVFHQALKESGYVEGEKVAIEHRWAETRICPSFRPGSALSATRGHGDRSRMSVAVAATLLTLCTASLPAAVAHLRRQDHRHAERLGDDRDQRGAAHHP
jgi:exosome complex RNA-binding protein Rrp42 (RNase PH superfamily)